MLKVEGDGDIAFFTQNGMVKRTTEKEMVVAKSYYQAIKLADNDKLIAVEHEQKGKSFVMLSQSGNCVNFEKSEVPMQGRIAGGVKGINMEEKDVVVYAGQNISGDYIIVTNNGFVKRLNALQIPMCARYRKGVRYINFADTGKAVAFVGISDKMVVDHGLKFSLLSKRGVQATNDRLATGEEKITKKFLGVYNYFD